MKRKRIKVTRLPEKQTPAYIKQIGDGLYEIGPKPKLICGEKFLERLLKTGINKKED